MRLLHLHQNVNGRDFIVGDVHTHFEKLQIALSAAGFDPSRGDRLISVGDLVGRGAAGNRALYLLNQSWFFAVMGNHEWMAIEAAEGRAEEGAETPILVPELIARLKQLPLAIELETSAGMVGIVHADVPSDSWSLLRSLLANHPERTNDLNDSLSVCLWSKLRGRGLKQGMPVEGSGLRAVVVGHYPVDEPTWHDNVLFIDTKGWDGGEFTLIEAESLAPLERTRSSWAQVD